MLSFFAAMVESWFRGVWVSGNSGGGGARSERDLPARSGFGGIVPLSWRSRFVVLLETDASADTADDDCDARGFTGGCAMTPPEFANFNAAATAIVPALEAARLRDCCVADRGV